MGGLASRDANAAILLLRQPFNGTHSVRIPDDVFGVSRAVLCVAKSPRRPRCDAPWKMTAL